MQERIRAWSEHHSNGLPKNIIFFRDGVSESQFETCNTHEVSEIEHAYNEICIERGIPSGQLKLTFVIAGKRHNTRFYPTESTQAYSFEKNTNVAPGLLVNDFITDPIRDKGLVKCDFYLQSHWAIQGTARSAHYHVLRDDLKFQGNQLQTLTHQLCYSFARATKGVSYVSPAYIADRLCERGRVYLRGWKPSDDFNEPKDENGNEIKEEKDIKLWKQGKARAVAQSALWGGRYNDDPANGPIRRNPWHTDLDDTMFWM